MARIFKRREYQNLQALINAVYSWVENTKEFSEASDFFITVRKPNDWER